MEVTGNQWSVSVNMKKLWITGPNVFSKKKKSFFISSSSIILFYSSFWRTIWTMNRISPQGRTGHAKFIPTREHWSYGLNLVLGDDTSLARDARSIGEVGGAKGSAGGYGFWKVWQNVEGSAINATATWQVYWKREGYFWNYVETNFKKIVKK